MLSAPTRAGKGITMDTEQFRRHLVLVRFQFFTELLDTLDALHHLLQLVTGFPELDRGASRVRRLSYSPTRKIDESSSGTAVLYLAVL